MRKSRIVFESKYIYIIIHLIFKEKVIFLFYTIRIVTERNTLLSEKLRLLFAVSSKQEILCFFGEDGEDKAGLLVPTD